MQPLVSIITPCYNGEKYLASCLDSVLAQTYDNVEFILVNDGSNDKTALIAEAYKEKFKLKGYIYIYIYQENKGVSAAVNRGLEIFNGKYLMLADSDDILEKDCIRSKVEYLERNTEIALVAARAKVVNERNINKTIGYLYNKSKNWCEDIVYNGGVECNPGIYMFKAEYFLKIYPQKTIFESRYGQNYQILIPLMYHFKYGKIDNIVSTYVIRDDSLSHKKEPLENILKRYDGYIEILENTTKYLPDDYRKYYMKKCYIYYAVKKFESCLNFPNIDLAKKYFNELKQFNINMLNYRRKYLKYRLKLLLNLI